MLYTAISRKVTLKKFGAFPYQAKITLGDVYSIMRKSQQYQFCFVNTFFPRNPSGLLIIRMKF